VRNRNQAINFRWNIILSIFKKHPDWQLADIYADDGKSGKGDKNRKRLYENDRRLQGGKIDKIITKSVSRFARNLMLCKNMF
jgi:site-specific DNA recombinase